MGVCVSWRMCFFEMFRMYISELVLWLYRSISVVVQYFNMYLMFSSDYFHNVMQDCQCSQ